MAVRLVTLHSWLNALFDASLPVGVLVRAVGGIKPGARQEFSHCTTAPFIVCDHYCKGDNSTIT